MEGVRGGVGRSLALASRVKVPPLVYEAVTVAPSTVLAWDEVRVTAQPVLRSKPPSEVEQLGVTEDAQSEKDEGVSCELTAQPLSE